MIEDIIDLDRYPIADLASPAAKALVARGRAQMADDGCLLLEGFIRPEAVARMAQDGRDLVADGHPQTRLRDREEGRRSGCFAWHRDSRVSMRCVGGDRMAEKSPLRLIHQWDPLTGFIGAVLGRDPFFRSADPMIGNMLGAHRVGDELDWHYDPNDGVVSLLVQRSDVGGRFEFAPMNRPDDPDEAVQREAIEAVMSGHWPHAREVDQSPGSLTLFNGSRSLHRVTPVEAGPERIMLLLSYDGRFDQIFRDEIRKEFFGRAA
ncbi:MAG: HalD/BesD family halogenase [Alphaproteobacteria bacterium]|jgi:hypothetical protein